MILKRPQHLIAALLVATALLVSGCGMMPSTETPAQNLAVVDAQFTAAIETATDMRLAGELSDEDTNRLNEIILRGNQVLSLAWDAMLAGRASDAERYVQLSQALLLQLRDYLEAREPST